MHIDVPQQLGATVRGVRLLEHLGQPARAVVATRTYHTDRDDLWDALTNAERIPRWFLPIAGELHVGGRYKFTGNAGGLIESCTPPSHLAVTWEMGSQVSWVRISLHAEDADNTGLELEHIALITDAGEPFWQRYGPGAVGVGWELGLMGLDRHLVTGEANDHEAAEAWTISPEGQAYVRGSSDGWGQAAIDAGDEDHAARQSAARTFAFYTGQPEPE